MITIYDVAKEAGVSPSTVSRVLNNYNNVTETTRKKVEAACKKLKYVPNANASSLKKDNTKTLALIIPDIENPFFISILKGFDDKANKLGYDTILCNTDERLEKEKDYIKMVLKKRIDGVAISTVGKTSEHISEFSDRNIPYILLDRKVEGLDADIVCGDNYQGAIDLVNHLINNGHKDIAMITGPLHVSTSRERFEGYKTALNRAGISVEEDYIKIDYVSQDYSGEKAYEMTKELLGLNEPPTAIFVANNLMALEVYKALKEEGISVPDDIAIVCFDDLNLIYEIEPFFTVMKQPAYTMGEAAAEILIKRIEMSDNGHRKRKIVFEPELIIRKSSIKDST
ncbi:LacI family DNA-binding transcriptional regulator [Halothermothrix orenii]|uniref:Transcriptional regulator, LacI family n=1 Tax=Halothermothrix orenii (strain H 168 / OCM 544 / DSM 9562) TaxID=373903 RepID=B8CWP0_HALOH|nr:transcriptional regulator, LacI family [Halothermothrix orenii H 168]